MGLCSSRQVTPAVRVWEFTQAHPCSIPHKLVCEITFIKNEYTVTLYNGVKIEFPSYGLYNVERYINESINSQAERGDYMYVETSWGYHSELFEKQNVLKSNALQERVLEKIEMMVTVNSMSMDHSKRVYQTNYMCCNK